jgi:hypothetical protein
MTRLWDSESFSRTYTVNTAEAAGCSVAAASSLVLVRFMKKLYQLVFHTD